MNQDFIRLGIIGIGNMGSEHCRNIAAGKCPEIRITAGADLRKDRRTWFRENIPEPVEVYESGEDLIHSSDCDAVLICVPHYGHEELAVSAMENGKHVLCEKPAAVTARAARHMCEVSGKTGKTLTFMFNQRTNCLYRGIHDVLSSGEFGKIKRLNWIVTDWYRTQKYYDSGSWRATWAGEGGGVLLNQCPHQLDLWQWICGMPVRVYADMKYGKWHGQLPHQCTDFVAESRSGLTTLVVKSLSFLREQLHAFIQLLLCLGNRLVDVLKGIHFFLKAIPQRNQCLKVGGMVLHHQAAEQVVAFLKALQLLFVKLGLVFLATHVVGNVLEFDFQVFNAFRQFFQVGQQMLQPL